MEERLNIRKGDTVWTAGQGNDLHVFESREACEEFCESMGRSFRPKEREIYKRYFCWTEVNHVGGSSGMEDTFYSVSRLSELTLSLLMQLEVRGFVKADPGNLPEGAWRWKIGHAPFCTWESEWYMPVGNI